MKLGLVAFYLSQLFNEWDPSLFRPKAPKPQTFDQERPRILQRHLDRVWLQLETEQRFDEAE